MRKCKLITKRILVSGRVQGVGFRRFIQKCAEDLTVVGTAQNKANGSVEIIATGAIEQLEALIEKAKQGPSFSHVRECQIEEVAEKQFSEFQIVKDEEF